VAYALSDEMKIIDLGWTSRSVTTSTVGPTLATTGLLVENLLSGVLGQKFVCHLFVYDRQNCSLCMWFHQQLSISLLSVTVTFMHSAETDIIIC